MIEVFESRVVGWHQVEWLDGIKLEEVLRATAMAWCWLARGLPRGPDPSTGSPIRLKRWNLSPPSSESSPQAGISYIRRRLYSGCEDSIPYGKESIVGAEEEHFTILTNGDMSVNR